MFYYLKMKSRTDQCKFYQDWYNNKFICAGSLKPLLNVYNKLIIDEIDVD